MKKLIVMLGLVIFGVFGCMGSKFPNPPTYTHKDRPNIEHVEYMGVYLDSQYTDGQKAQIKEALNEMNTVLNGYRVYTVMDENLDTSSITADVPADAPSDEIVSLLEGGDNVIFFDVPPGNKQLESVDEGVLAFTLVEVNCVFMLPSRISLRNFQQIALHELIHTEARHGRGLEHLMIKSSIEYPIYSVNYGSCVDYLTMREIADSLNLPEENLNYCGEIPTK